MIVMEKTKLHVDFHCHTVVSGDSLTTPERLVRAARRRGLDRIVITDHNEIAGALAANAIDPELVIVGEEVMTTDGELLAAYVKERVPAGLSAMDAILAMRAQDAFISVSHPFDTARNGWEVEKLDAILPYVDAIEVFNARCYPIDKNTQALNYSQRYGVARTAGSDAHSALEIGRGRVVLPLFENAEELRAAIQAGTIIGKSSSVLVRFISRYAVLVKSLRKAL